MLQQFSASVTLVDCMQMAEGIVTLFNSVGQSSDEIPLSYLLLLIAILSVTLLCHITYLLLLSLVHTGEE